MVLLVVMALMVILAAWAFSMSFYSQSSTQQSARAQYNERCADLAQMAIIEAMHAIRTRVNDPTNPVLFDAFRADNPPPLEIVAADLRLTMAEAERFPNYSVSKVDVVIPRRTSIGVEAEERVPYEAVGIARFTVTVTGPQNTQVNELVEYGFRSVLTAPPRPLDMLSFFLADPRTLLVKGAYQDDPNATIQW